MKNLAWAKAIAKTLHTLSIIFGIIGIIRMNDPHNSIILLGISLVTAHMAACMMAALADL